jgi:hypothetical protein
MNQQQHEMILEMNHPSGVQGWFCPICGQRILIGASLANGMVIVEPGNQDVRHSGSTGGFNLGPIQAVQQEDAQRSEERLRPWMNALKDLDLDW